MNFKKFISFFSFLVFIGCNGSGGGGGAGGGAAAVKTNALTGTLTYDYVPIQDSIGLNYSATSQKPMRKIYLEALDSVTDLVVATTSTNDLGQFTLNVPETSTMVYLFIHSEIKSPSVLVQDNTQGNIKYVLSSTDYTITSPTDIGTLNASSGWNSGSQTYASSRNAAPFAILDTILTAFEKVQAAKPSLVFPQLKINWSINNTNTSGDITIGQINTSHYRSQTGQLYILGKAGVDTDEYDTHVMVHEWGHYFEDKLGRSDNPGGNHGNGEIKDMSLAFGEGFGNALSAMIMDPDVTYRDSQGLAQASVSGMNLESDSNTNPGWFSEASVQQILFDIYDSTNDTGDTVSLGLPPIIDIMTTHQMTTRASTSIFSFINGLKTNYSSYSTAINTLTSSKSISPIQDDFGTGETHYGDWSYNLPVYNEIIVGGANVTTQLWGSGNILNDLVNNRYFNFTATSTNTQLTWQSSDSYIIVVFDGNTQVHINSQTSTGGALPSLSYDMATVPGQIYRIRVLSNGNAYDPNNYIQFILRADNI